MTPTKGAKMHKKIIDDEVKLWIAPGRGRSHPCRPFAGVSVIWTSSSADGQPMAFRAAWLAAFKALE